MLLTSSLDNTLLLPFQLMLDLGQQLSPDLYNILKKKVFEEYFEIKTANDWINLEAFGNMTALRAQTLSHILKDYCAANDIHDLDVYIHLNGVALTSDNVYSLIYLKEHSEKLKVSVQHSISEKTSIVNNLIEKRFSVLKEIGFDFKRSESSDEFESSKIVDHSIGYAWSILKLGAYDVATNVLLKVLHLDTLAQSEYESILMHLQLIRFHSHQYEAVTSQLYPAFESLDKQSIVYLHYIKAYAATLSRNAEVAGQSFAACEVDKDLPIENEFNLYQLNIFALYNAITQKIDVAYDLEMRIEAFITQNDIASVGLKYVNNINIARLYKKLEKYDLSFKYYEKAYDALSGGGYTTSDYIYYSMNLGSLFEAQGHSDKALVCWIKAGLHWLVSKNPYSLAWRPKIILCNEKTSDLNQPVSLEKITQFFVNKITSLLAINQIYLKNRETLHFDLNEGRIAGGTAYMTDCFIMYGRETESTLEFSALKPLQALLSDACRYFFTIDENCKTLSVDYLSEAILRKSKAFWPLGLIHTCPKWIINGEVVSRADMQALKSTLKVHLSCSSMIENTSASNKALNLKYKRSFMNKQLIDETEIVLFKEIEEKRHILLATDSSLSNKMIDLLYKNVLEIQFQNKDDLM